MRSEDKGKNEETRTKIGGEWGNLCSRSKVCDGTNNCGGWEDEPERGCGVDECAEENGGCDQVFCTPSLQPGQLFLCHICLDITLATVYTSPTLDLCGHTQELPLQLPTGLET